MVPQGFEIQLLVPKLYLFSLCLLPLLTKRHATVVRESLGSYISRFHARCAGAAWSPLPRSPWITSASPALRQGTVYSPTLTRIWSHCNLPEITISRPGRYLPFGFLMKFLQRDPNASSSRRIESCANLSYYNRASQFLLGFSAGEDFARVAIMSLAFLQAISGAEKEDESDPIKNPDLGILVV